MTAVFQKFHDYLSRGLEPARTLAQAKSCGSDDRPYLNTPMAESG